MINNSNLVRVVELQNKVFCLIEREVFQTNKRYIKHNSSLGQVFLFQYKGQLFRSYRALAAFFPELPKPRFRDKSMERMKVPKKHCNQTVERQHFCAEHAGKTLGELGLKVYNLEEFNYIENKDIIQ